MQLTECLTLLRNKEGIAMTFKKLVSSILLVTTILGTFPVLTNAENVEIYMDMDSKGYKEESGLFLYDPAINKDPNGKATRYSYSKYARLSYSPEIEESGRYAVYHYSTGCASNLNQTPFTILSKDGETKLLLNLRGEKGWKLLGVYNFEKGGAAKVTLSREIKGGCIRSAAVKFVKTDAPLVVPNSEAKKVVPRYVSIPNGIYVDNRVAADVGKYEQANGGFADNATWSAAGHPIKYSYNEGAIMRYRPTIKEAGEYHVMLFSTPASNAPAKMETVVSYGNGQSANFVINKRIHTNWIYLGKYDFVQGTSGYVETVNTDAGYLASDGVYFIKADSDFDPKVYATVDKPGLRFGEKANDKGEFVIATTSKGFSYASCYIGNFNSMLDVNNDYLQVFGGEATVGHVMNYTADIKNEGEYEVFYYVIDDAGIAPEQLCIINTADGEKEVTVNCKENKGWVSLGTYKFNGNISSTVTTPSMGAAGNTYSGGVKFVKK